MWLDYGYKVNNLNPNWSFANPICYSLKVQFFLREVFQLLLYDLNNALQQPPRKKKKLIYLSCSREQNKHSIKGRDFGWTLETFFSYNEASVESEEYHWLKS